MWSQSPTPAPSIGMQSTDSSSEEVRALEADGFIRAPARNELQTALSEDYRQETNEMRFEEKR